MTAYGEDDFLIDNSIDRYCINDRSDFKLNADGTLDIILSKDAPEDTSNWLPVSDGGISSVHADLCAGYDSTG